ncbi:MAG: N-acetylmuramoyl-L-alanine amidase [Fluviicola sp.]|nr:N-acetylmuramoyl-L-alanine amidase [Fluviicola sp.]
MIEKLKRYSRICAILVSALLFSVNFALSQEDEEFYAAIKTVVIDAGHGGKDPGCHGASAKEKDVCLAMALQLGEKISTNFPHIKVIYTRKTDVFVELGERAKIANRNNADLFICIHANAASPAAYGTETYVLGLHRTESQQKVAARENATIHFEDDGGAKYKDFDMSPDAIIARQIQLSVFLDQSISFASKLQVEFKTLGRHDRGVKQAGFLVLYKTTMPSVLIETGFLTNPKEEKFLNTKETQKTMSASMFKAFQKYKNELEGVEEETENNSPFVPNENDSIQKSNTSASSGTEIAQDEVEFRVQIETSKKKIALTSSKFKGYTVAEYVQNGLFKYTVGSYTNDFHDANHMKKKLRENGFQHAFVVGFLNGERINLQKAIKLAEN